MNATLPGLIVPIEARIDKLEKGLLRANRAQRRTAQSMERRAKQSADRIGATYSKMSTNIAASFKRMALPLVGGIASAGAARSIVETTKAVARLGDEAKRAGVPLKDFQEWSYVAQQNRIGIDQMVDGLKELNLRADEFVSTGKGPAAEAFARLGLGADDLSEKLKDPSKLLLEIFERARRLKRAGRIRVADEIFGGSAGERFVELMARSDAELRNTISKAHELGAVLDDEVVRSADETARKFDELTTRIGGYGKRLAVALSEGVAGILSAKKDLEGIFGDLERAEAVLGKELAQGLEENKDALAAHAGDLRELHVTYDDLFGLINRMTGPDGVRVFDIDDTDARFALADIMGDLKRLVDQLEGGSISATEFEKEVGDLVGEARDVAGELATIDDVGFSSVISAIGGIGDALDRAIGKAHELKTKLPGNGGYTSSGRGDGGAEAERRRFESNQSSSDLAPTSSLRPRSAPPLVDEIGTKPRSGGSARSDDFERVAASIRSEISLLELEATALIATAVAGAEYAGAIEIARKEAELLHAAQQAGKQITPALRAEIRALAKDYTGAAQAAGQTEQAHDRLQSAKDEVRDTLGGAFTDLVTGARDFDSVLQSVLGSLAEMAASKAFEGIFSGISGGGSGWLGTALSLFGFSGGGYTGDGSKYQPAGVVHRGEYVMSKAATENIGVGNLEALHSAAKKGFASGGYVGGTAPLKPRAVTRSESLATTAPQITIHAPVTVQGSAGTPEQNSDMAKQMARQMEGTVRGVVVDEMRRQQRPGNLLNNRRH